MAPRSERTGETATTVMWFRRDLRLSDNPALLEAVEQAAPGGAVLPLFVFDPRLWRPAGDTRRAYLVASLETLRQRIGGLVVRTGDPVDVLPAVVRETKASSVHVAEDFGPYGRHRDERVERSLAELDV